MSNASENGQRPSPQTRITDEQLRDAILAGESLQRTMRRCVDAAASRLEEQAAQLVEIAREMRAWAV